ncbi:MAG: branched-chain amino acid transaminase [Chloroflexi bacterium]|nr:branched-chain amino acid transaminase [Chloroflexota bacterium]
MAGYCYLDGKVTPLDETMVNIRTHALHYGTGCFEGIRGYWNEEHEELYVLHLREHFQRMERSGRILKIKLPFDPDGLAEITLDLLRRNGDRNDVYIRPLAFKGDHSLGPRVHDCPDSFAVYAFPLGKYIENDKPIRCGVSTWRRVDDNGIPARAKVTGLYINSALARTEANENGYDEAIVLTHDGHVSEGSAENIFIVQDGQLITPPPSDNILVGITRKSVMLLAREELGIPTIERQIDRTELYISDEVFLCGTGAEITPVGEIDRRPIGNGQMGPITRQLQQIYFAAVRGQVDRYRHWLSPVFASAKVATPPAT